MKKSLDEGAFRNNLFNIFRDIEKVFGLAKRGTLPKQDCDTELNKLYARLQKEYDDIWSSE